MKQELNKCIEYLTIAKEAVSKEDSSPDIALDYLNRSQEILNEFMTLNEEDKAELKDQLLEIQALGQFINAYLAKNKQKLQNKALHSNKMNKAIKGYNSKM